jgi:hypothetical protein
MTVGPRGEEAAGADATEPTAERSGVQRLSRRQALGRLSALATAGAAAWVVPEILTAKPAAGAVLSGSTEGITTSPGSVLAATTTGSTTSTSPPPEPPLVTLAGALAQTGLDLQRDAEIGAALVAGGWAMRHWASRPAAAAKGGTTGTAPGPQSPAQPE